MGALIEYAVLGVVVVGGAIWRYRRVHRYDNENFQDPVFDDQHRRRGAVPIERSLFGSVGKASEYRGRR